ncbi:family 20 glycosylhydrolase [Flavihumibacter profundi]|uniref:family 20 glycosylhydrolase n=1 Tax=Flavihumibacter profundi TaxID=2716883 RepID=UPI001CC67317|nr:family 20 glycosylhydrolase [Flavihumibacter profundi]MBZ5856757.1 carbohydate-binding domain-containing protein [Flavihumibacter profundi]
MKRKIFLIFPLLFLLPMLQAQTSKLFPAGKLAVQWVLESNNYGGKPKALNILTLTNKGKRDFPKSGWTIYFSTSYDITPDRVVAGLQYAHVNGDIFKCFPTAAFEGIKPGKSMKSDFLSDGKALNNVAAPSGLYIVWDTYPDQGFALTDYKVLPSKDTTENYKTPAIVYEENKQVEEIAANKLPVVFPTPVSFTGGDASFSIDQDIAIITGNEFAAEADFLADAVSRLIGKRPVIASTFIQSVRSINIIKAPMKEEAYRLVINKDGIEISAGSGAGVFYAIQSLLNMISPDHLSEVKKSVPIPAATIVDEPRFGYRGFTLDIARNFQPKNELLRIIDLMAMYKLNNLHLHFNDDEGWRIAMPSFPELTAIGSQRGHTLDSKKWLPPSYGAGPDPGKLPASGFYTRAEFIDILRYAKARHIVVLPEIETPGHARAAIKSMDARYEKYMKQGNPDEAKRYLLRDINDQSVYSTAQQWTDNVMCVALPSVYNFIEKIVDDVVSMYKEAGAPLTTIHFGGDEVPDGAWEKSPLCQELVKQDPSLQETNDLWYYYFTKVDQILKKHQLTLSGWEEVGMRKTTLKGVKKLIVNPVLANEGYRLYVWNNMVGSGNEDLPYRLANAGYKVILAPVSNNYFDMAYYKSTEEPGYFWGGFTDVDKTFSFTPFDYFKNTKEDAAGNPVGPETFIGKDQLTAYGQANIVGLQGLIWSEMVRSEERLEYMALPKLLGLAERAWSPDPSWANEPDTVAAGVAYKKAWSTFTNVLGKRELPRLSYTSGGYKYRIPAPGVLVKDGLVLVNQQLPGFVLKYSTDGKEPLITSATYTEPITEKGTVRVRAFDVTGRGSRIVTVVNQ